MHATIPVYGHQVRPGDLLHWPGQPTRQPLLVVEVTDHGGVHGRAVLGADGRETTVALDAEYLVTRDPTRHYGRQGVTR